MSYFNEIRDQIIGSDSAEFNQWRRAFAIQRVRLIALIGPIITLIITLAEVIVRPAVLPVNSAILLFLSLCFWLVYLGGSRYPLTIFVILFSVCGGTIVATRFGLLTSELRQTTLPAAELAFILFTGVLLLPVYWRVHLIAHILLGFMLVGVVVGFGIELPPVERARSLWILFSSAVALFSVIIQQNSYRRQEELILKVQKTESQYRDIFNNAGEGIYRSIPNGGFVTVNQAMARILGYESAETLLDDNPSIESMFLEPNGRAELPDREVGNDHRLIDVRFPLKRPDGKIIHVAINSRAALDEDGNRFYEGFMQDVSAQHAAQKALENRERILSAITFATEQFLRASSWEHVADGVLECFGKATDADRAFIFEIKSAEENSFASLRSAWRHPELPSLLEQLPFDHIPLNTIGMKLWIQQLENRRPIEQPIATIPNQQARAMWSQLNINTIVAVPVLVADQLWGCMGFTTHDKHKQSSPSEIDALQVAANNLGAAIEREKIMQEFLQGQKQESLGVLVGGIAHDFNNLLTGMLSQASLAAFKLPEGHEVRGHIDKAVFSAERAADLTRQLLAYAGKGRFHVEPVNLTQLMEDNLSLFDLAIPGNVVLDLQLSQDLPFVEADRGQMQQLVMNLVLNAGEAMQTCSEGKLTIRTSSAYIETDNSNAMYLGGTTLPAGPYVHVEVIDTGVGMNENTLGSIFDPYFSTKPEGQGLGLSATLGIIRSHNGGIQVVSELHNGTQFDFWLPAMETTIIEAQNGNSIGEVSSMVMIVDDEELVREAVSDILEFQGIDVLLAASGSAGIELYRKRKAEIRAIVLDMRMPGMNGRETYYGLKEVDPDVVVLMSSGFSEMEISAQFEPGEIAGFLQKPYNLDTLTSTIQSLLK
ncbi:MAG: response regulator [Candidatus Promineifilaceae bacterium]